MLTGSRLPDRHGEGQEQPVPRRRRVLRPLQSSGHPRLAGQGLRFAFTVKTVTVIITDFDASGNGLTRAGAAYPWRGASGSVHNVRLRKLPARSENGVIIRAEESGCISGVVFDGVRVEIDRWSGRKGGHWDLRPHPSGGITAKERSGFHDERASNVTLLNCEVVWAQQPATRSPDLRHALFAVQVDGLRLRDFRGESADHRNFEAVIVDGVPQPVGRY